MSMAYALKPMAQTKAKRAAPPGRARKAGAVKPPPRTAATERFTKDLLVRGEAAELTKSGKLPLDATHVIEKRNPDGTVEVRRVRYKAF